MRKYLMFLVGLVLLYGQTITTIGGWQLVGAKEDIVPSESFNNSDITAVWAYDEENNRWKLYYKSGASIPIQGVDPLDYIEEGEGFWIYTVKPLSIDTGLNSVLPFVKKEKIIGRTFFYLDKNLSTKEYEENLTSAMENNASVEFNVSYMPEYEVHKIYFEPDYITIDNNQTFSAIWEKDRIRLYGPQIKDSFIKINRGNNNELNITISINALNPFEEQNITSLFNRYDGTFIVAQNRPTHIVQQYHTDENGNIIFNECSNGWSPECSDIRSVELNSTNGSKIATIRARRHENYIDIINDTNTSAVKVTFFPFYKDNKITRIYYSRSEQKMVVFFDTYCCFMGDSQRENQMFDLTNPLEPDFIRYYNEKKDGNLSVNGFEKVLDFAHTP